MCCFISGKSIFSVITSFCHVPSLHHLLWKIYICLLLCPSPALLSLHDLVLNESFSAILLTCQIPALLTLLSCSSHCGLLASLRGGRQVLVSVMLPGCGGAGSLYVAVVGAVCALVPCLWGFRILHCWWWKSRPINGILKSF